MFPEEPPCSRDRFCIAVLQVRRISTALVVADVCAKAGDVPVVGIESNGTGDTAIKLAGPTADVETAPAAGRRSTEAMHACFAATAVPRCPEDARSCIHCERVYNPLIEAHGHRFPPSSTSGAGRRGTT